MFTLGLVMGYVGRPIIKIVKTLFKNGWAQYKKVTK
jgi:hypothetical protein